MPRLSLIIFFLWLCGEAAGQGINIPRSTDIVVIRGESYYLHTVQPGQTLYSISKAYGVGTEELKALNDKKDNRLSLYEVLKIPFIEPFIQQDGKYYYHKVAQGETLYSIARHFGIKIRRLLKYNENYSHNEAVPVGAVVRLPLKEINLTILPSTDKVLPNVQAEQETTKEMTSVTEENLSMKMIPAGKQEEKRIPEIVSPSGPFVRVALLLPFFARKYTSIADSLAMKESFRIPARDERFLYFYEGILLAVDSLKNRGCQVELHVYDTERNAEKMYSLSEEINRLQPDLIIGPVYGSVFKVLAERLENKNIPIVFPLSSRSENFGMYPNFIQVNASYARMVNVMAHWIREQQKKANVIQINLSGEEEAKEEEPEKRFFTDKMIGLGGVDFFNWDVANMPLDTLRTLLLPDRENILLFPATKEKDVTKVLPMLSALTDSYRLTVVGLPEWQMFASVDHETYYKLNTKIFTYSYVDNAAVGARKLTEKFRKYFYTEPQSLAFKAFDIGLYFIDLADKYRGHMLEAIGSHPKEGEFSRFHFGRINQGVGKENQGFFIVSYGSDYQLKIETAEHLPEAYPEQEFHTNE